MYRINRRWIVPAIIAVIFGAISIRALSEPNNDFRFSILGDRTGGAQPEVYGRVWREVDLQHPDFIINVGDTIQGGNDARAPAEWADVRRVWERYEHFPLYLTPGNHDIWSSRSQALYEEQTGYPPYYSFNYQDAHFTVLDNSRTADLSAEQLDFLEKDLQENQERSPKFVLFHRPFWISLLRRGDTSFRLHQLALKYGVGCIISGHGHQFVRMVADGVAYMEVGSSGGVMSGTQFSQGWFYQHVWARVKGANVYLTVKELDGVRGRGRSFRAEDWDQKGPGFNVDDPASSYDPET